MDNALLRVIERLHASSTSCAFCVTGGGARALGWLAAVPRASNTLITAHVPYDARASRSYAKKDTNDDVKFVSREFARALAEEAYKECVRVGGASEQNARTARGRTGIGATCALTREIARKKGEHKIVVCARSVDRMATYEIVLEKDSGRGRFAEDECASRAVIRAAYDEAWHRERMDGGEMLASASAGEDLVRAVLSKGEFAGMVVDVVAEEAYGARDARATVERWMKDDSPSAPGVLEFTEGMLTAVGATRANVVLSGSFNPLHDGHRELLAAATATKPPGALGAYEISVVNADKGALSVDEIVRRLAQFHDSGVVCLLTKSPLFVDKTKVAPGASFVVGVDTATRLLNPKYHGGEDGLSRSLDEIRRNSCDFIVAGRVDPATNEFIAASSIRKPFGCASLFVDAPHFRNDLSSTAIRAAIAKAAHDSKS